jgi:hypothetical protein
VYALDQYGLLYRDKRIVSVFADFRALHSEYIFIWHGTAKYIGNVE